MRNPLGTWRLLVVVLLVAGCCVLLTQAAERERERELVRRAPGVEEQLAERGAVVLEEYGAFLLVEWPDGAVAPLGAAPGAGSPSGTSAGSAGVAVRPGVRPGAGGGAGGAGENELVRMQSVGSRVMLPAGALDTSGGSAGQVPGTFHGPARLAAAGTAAAATAEGGTRGADRPSLHLVQFHGPVKDAWLRTLEREGVEVVGYAPENAFLVRATAEQVALLESAPFDVGPAGRAPLHWTGAYEPQFKLRAELLDEAASRAPEGGVDVFVRVVDAGNAEALLEELGAGPRSSAARSRARAAAGEREVRMAPTRVGRTWIVATRMTAEEIETWAAHPDVVDIARWSEPQLMGEVGALNVAGQRVNGTVPGFGLAGVDYLTWLSDRGFDTSSPWSFTVNVADTGFDKGAEGGNWHQDFMEPDGTGARVVFVKDWTSDAGTADDGIDGNGHGTNCAGVVGGYNDAAGTGTGEVSTTGYHFGLGVAPAVKLGGSKIFNRAGAWDYSGDVYEIEEYAYGQGARISSNSWGSSNTAYDAWSAIYDRIVRDASSAAGLQPMIVLFAAGNSGPNTDTVGSPGTAKNTITLGAAENWWPGYSSCGWSSAFTNTPGDDIVRYSSRGPVEDGRLKPDVVAIANGWNTTRGVYAGSGCGAPFDTGDASLYRNFNGTSAATPAAAGAAALLYQYALDNWGGAPSPAMVKAVLAATARDLEGGVDADAYDGTGPELDPIPNGSQGWGLVDTGRMFDGTSVVRVDQSALLSGTGESWSVVVTPEDTSQPVRIALAWTDAPGTVYSAPWVNNLDLTVVHGGDTYFGNVFSGGMSAMGGAADALNNLELVKLDAGESDSLEIAVTATNIAGDGVPGNGDATDQDFALFVYNATVCTPPAAPGGLAAQLSGSDVELDWSASGSGLTYRVYRSQSLDGPWSVIAATGMTNYTDQDVPGGVDLYYAVRAVDGCESAASNVVSVSTQGECMPTFAGVVSAEPTPGPACEMVLEWEAATAAAACPDSVLRYDVHRSTNASFTPTEATRIATGVEATSYVDAGATVGGQAYTYVVRAVDTVSGDTEGNLVRVTATQGQETLSGPGNLDIPDDTSDGVTADIRVRPGTVAAGVLSDVQLGVSITHEWVGDVRLYLTDPTSFEVLILREDFDNAAVSLETVFDRETDTDTSGSMNLFDGQSGVGTWTLEAEDRLVDYVGTVDEWWLEFTAECEDLAGGVGEASPDLEMTARVDDANADAVAVSYVPAANAVDTAVYYGATYGSTPMSGVAWDNVSTGHGLDGELVMDWGWQEAGTLIYFVVVGVESGVSYGPTGRDSAGNPRPTDLVAAAGSVSEPGFEVASAGSAQNAELVEFIALGTCRLDPEPEYTPVRPVLEGMEGVYGIGGLDGLTRIAAGGGSGAPDVDAADVVPDAADPAAAPRGSLFARPQPTTASMRTPAGDKAATQERTPANGEAPDSQPGDDARRKHTDNPEPPCP